MLQNGTPIEAYRRLNEKMNSASELPAVPLNVSLIYKQSLDQYPEYTYLKEKLNSYTKKVNRTSKVDEYEIRTYEKLFHLLYDMTSVDIKQLQQAQLKQIKVWLENQEKIIKNRGKQAGERSKITKESRRASSLNDKLSPANNQSPVIKPSVPSDLIQEAVMPYLRKWRTSHPGIASPGIRLNYYERKKLDIEPTPNTQANTPQKHTILNSNISYALTPSLPDTSTIEKGEEDGKEVQTQIQLQQPSIANMNQLPEEIALPDDIPMFGQEPEEPQQSRDGGQQGDGDLVPRVKLYLSQTKIAPKEEQKTSYVYMREKLSIEEKRLEDKFKRMRDNEIMQKNQDKELIEYAQRLARNKSTTLKQQQKKLQMRASSPCYCILEEQAKEQFQLPEDLERKYHLSQSKNDRRGSRIDLEFHLPKLNSGRASVNIQRNIEKPSLDVLKKRLSHVLNLPSDQDQEPRSASVPKSMAQYTGRTRPFSEVLQQINKKFNKQQQIEQLQTVRERLNAKKVGINVRALVNGLCLPEDNPLDIQQMPEKNLLHNEFMADAKKGKGKKKKKK